MLPSLSYTSTVFMSLVCVDLVQALHMILASMGYISTTLTINSRTAQLHKPKHTHRKTTTTKKTKNIPMSPVQLKINVKSPPEDNVCLLGNFMKVTAAQAERLVVGLGCMWESSQQTAHLRWAPKVYSGVRRIIFAFHQISFLSPFFHLSSCPPFPLLLSFSISLQGSKTIY